MRIYKRQILFSYRETVIACVLALVLVFAVFFHLQKARGNLRDAARIEDMVEIRQALRLFKINNGYFPRIENPIIITGTDIFSEMLRNDFVVSEVFRDPIHPEFMYTYQSSPTGEYYIIRFCLETKTVVNFTRGCDNTITNY